MFLFVLISWRSWILRILDPRFVFHHGIVEILHLHFCSCGGTLEILDPNFLFGREIQQILDPD